MTAGPETISRPSTVLKPAGTAASGFGRTRRRDRWWIAPSLQGTVFTICATYLFVSGILLTPLFGTAYEVDGYLSPLFSPLILPGWSAASVWRRARTSGPRPRCSSRSTAPPRSTRA